jgi:hypothetical protein
MVGEYLNELGQDEIPALFVELDVEGLVDRMDALADSTSIDSRGAIVKPSTDTIYEDIPVVVEKNKTGQRLSVGDKPISYGNYLLTFPVVQNGARINLKAEH